MRISNNILLVWIAALSCSRNESPSLVREDGLWKMSLTGKEDGPALYYSFTTARFHRYAMHQNDSLTIVLNGDFAEGYNWKMDPDSLVIGARKYAKLVAGDSALLLESNGDTLSLTFVRGLQAQIIR